MDFSWERGQFHPRGQGLSQAAWAAVTMHKTLPLSGLHVSTRSTKRNALGPSPFPPEYFPC